MKISKRKTRTGLKVAALTGLVLIVASVAGAVIKRTTDRRARFAELTARDDAEAEAKARMDGEGGSMQPVGVS